MGTSKRTDLATAVALVVASAAVAPPAEAQSSLTVYSRDLSGPNSAAPSGATQGTVFDVSVPRLRAVRTRLLAVRSTLASHAMPDHDHPHGHAACVTPPPPPIHSGHGGDGGGDGYGDGGDGDGSDGGPTPGTPSATPGPGEMGANPGDVFSGPSNGGDGAGDGGGSR